MKTASMTKNFYYAIHPIERPKPIAHLGHLSKF